MDYKDKIELANLIVQKLVYFGYVSPTDSVQTVEKVLDVLVDEEV